MPANHPHLCPACQCPESVNANQALNWTQLTPPFRAIHPTLFKYLFLSLSFPPLSLLPILPLSSSCLCLSLALAAEDTFHFWLTCRGQLMHWLTGQGPSSAACHPHVSLRRGPTQLPYHCHHLHRDQNALIQFMQSLLFLNSHYVCSDEGP